MAHFLLLFDNYIIIVGIENEHTIRAFEVLWNDKFNSVVIFAKFVIKHEKTSG